MCLCLQQSILTCSSIHTHTKLTGKPPTARNASSHQLYIRALICATLTPHVSHMRHACRAVAKTGPLTALSTTAPLSAATTCWVDA